MNPKTDTPRIELADIFRQHAHRLGKLSHNKTRVIQNIIDCRTAALKGHLNRAHCNQCGYVREQSYNSCRNRHCPKCQGMSAVRWTEKRVDDLLEVPYFHGVFTLPHLFNPLALANKNIFYNLIFQSVSATLKAAAHNPENLGAEIGFIGVLHTWTQLLGYHVHVHCVIPGGGLSSNGQAWKACPENFFIHTAKLSAIYRGIFLQGLEHAYNQHKLHLPGELQKYTAPWRFKQLLIHSCEKQWVVYAKQPFAGPQQVLRYLSRYTQRIAISNKRIVHMDNDHVTFVYQDRKDSYAQKLKSMKVLSFIKRFLLHIVPRRFTRIRYYGFLSNRNRVSAIKLIRKLLGTPKLDPENKKETWQELLLRITGIDFTRCPRCSTGRMLTRTAALRHRTAPHTVGGINTS